MNILAEEARPCFERLIRVGFARLAVTIEKHTETLFRLNRCPVTHVVEDRVQLPPLLRDELFSSAYSFPLSTASAK